MLRIKNGAETAAFFSNTKNIMAINQAAGAVAGFGQGVSQYASARNEANALEAQSQLVEAEAEAEARRKERQIRSFRDAQAARFNKSGVMLEGTPLLVLQETINLGREEVDAVLARGNAQANLVRTQAGRTRSAGRNALIGGLTGAVSGLGQGAAQRRTLSLYSGAPAQSTTSAFNQNFLFQIDPNLTFQAPGARSF